MSSQGLTVTQVQDAIQARIERLWGPKDEIPAIVAGALGFIAVAATVITVSIYARKNRWMPIEKCQFKEVDGKRICYGSTNNYTQGPVLFGTLAGIPGSIVSAAVAAGVTTGLIGIPKGIKYWRLESEKTRVTGDNAMQIFHKQVRYLPEETLSSCAKTMTFSQLASLKELLPDDQFWRLATDLPESGHKRCAWRLLRDLKDAEDQPAFVNDHAQAFRDYAMRFKGFSEQIDVHIPKEKALPKLAECSPQELMGYIKQELESPNPALRKELKEAVRTRLTSKNANDWVTFLEKVAESADLSVDRAHPIASYQKRYDEHYMDLLVFARNLAPRKDEHRKRVDAEPVGDRPGLIYAPGHPAIAWFKVQSEAFETRFAWSVDGGLDFSGEPPEVQKGVAYLIRKIKPRQTAIVSAINRMLTQHLEDAPAVVKACEKFQLRYILGEIENQLLERIKCAKAPKDKLKWLNCMPESKKLIKDASAHLSALTQSQLIAWLKATKDPREQRILKKQIIRKASQRSALRDLRELDALTKRSRVVPPDLKSISDHDERLRALKDYERQTHGDVRNAIRDGLAVRLETPDRINPRHASLPDIWTYAEAARDERLMSACAEFLSHSRSARVLNKLPDLWEGRIPQLLYTGWRRNPLAEDPETPVAT